MKQIDLLVSKIHALEPFPAVSLRVMELSGRDDVVPAELVEVIRTDAGITAKLLRLCNSAYFGFARQVDSIEEAGNRLGVDMMVNLVLTACSGSYFRGGDSERDQELWERSISNALACSLLAEIQGDVDRSAAYTVGLLQDIGESILERFLPEVAEDVRRAVASGRDRTEAERELLGEDHAALGARVAELWQFPAHLVDAIRHHHAPEGARTAPELAALGGLADAVTTTLRAEPDDAVATLREVTADVLRLVGLDGVGIDSIESRVRGELERAREFLAL